MSKIEMVLNVAAALFIWASMFGLMWIAFALDASL